MTLKNTPTVDILATNLKNGTFANIQVKTRSLQNKQGWKLNYKVEEKSNIKNHFYVFVKLKGENDLPDYYVIPHNEFADFQKEKHQRWLLMKNINGGEHKDNKIRNFKPEQKNHVLHNTDYELGNKYKDKWDILGIFE